MGRFLLIILFGISGSCALHAQNTLYLQESENVNVGIFEFEIFSAGTLLAPNKTISLDGLTQKSSTRPGIGMGAEIRFNLPETPFSLGLQYSVDSFIRQWNDTREWENLPVDEERFIRARGTVNALQLTADYNFRSNSDFSWFAGIGYGYADSNYDFAHVHLLNMEMKRTTDIGAYHKKGFNAFSVRCGMEYENAVRVTAYCNYVSGNLYYFGLKLGLVIGGRER